MIMADYYAAALRTHPQVILIKWYKNKNSDWRIDMSLVKFKDVQGNEHTISGDNALNQVADMICQEMINCSFAKFIRLIASVEFEYNSEKVVFIPSFPIKYVKAATVKADMSQMMSRMKEVNDKYGFEECPDCGSVHNRKVTTCRACAHKVDLPEEALAVVQQFIKSLDKSDDEEPEEQEQKQEQEQEQEQEQSQEMQELPEEPVEESVENPAPSSQLLAMGSDEE